MPDVRVGILGATGLVGEHLLSILAERRFPVSELRLWGSERSRGRRLDYRGEALEVTLPTEADVASVDLLFGAAGNGPSERFVPAARAAGALVVDKAGVFRMRPDVPLVVPEVNPQDLPASVHGALVASPNCSTIPLVMVLKALGALQTIERVTVSTYQAVSGSGRDALEEFEAQEAAREAAVAPMPRAYPAPIFRNVLAQCDTFGPDGATREETKLVEESRKILGRPDLRLSATAVRVPVRVGHSEAVGVEFDRPVEPAAARAVLGAFEGLRLYDDPPAGGEVPTPLAAAGRDEVLVGRVRADPGVPGGRGLLLWLSCDNLRKGAALNAIQIAERMLVAGAGR